MRFLRSVIKPVTHLVLVGFIALTLQAPVSHAALVDTDTIVNTVDIRNVRGQLHATLDRADVKQALLAHGVSPDQVQARVDALSDQETRQLAAEMDQMPAGGDALGLAVFVFLVLLLTDILGFTDIFPFVKKTAR